ncbi:MAG: hypothetical protein MUO31_00850 [Thermodesulfovibrionales bacterium]|nr:hypothetical protein [Thermodesulfovibrionales bacterium]
MNEKHYCLEEALTHEGGVFNQTYDLKIVNVGETKEVTFGNGEKHKVQALKVSDGTAEIRWSIFDPDRIFTEGMDVHLENVYIKEKDGYIDLRVAKAGADKIRYSDTSDVKAVPKKEKVIPSLKEENETDKILYFIWETLKFMWGTQKEILDQLEKKGEGL